MPRVPISDDNGYMPAIGDDDEGRVIAQPDREPRYVASVIAAVVGLTRRDDLPIPARDPHLRDVIFHSPQQSSGEKSGLRVFEQGGVSVADFSGGKTRSALREGLAHNSLVIDGLTPSRAGTAFSWRRASSSTTNWSATRGRCPLRYDSSVAPEFRLRSTTTISWSAGSAVCCAESNHRRALLSTSRRPRILSDSDTLHRPPKSYSRASSPTMWRPPTW